MHMKYIILTGLFSLFLTLLPAPPARAVEVADTGTCGETAAWLLYDNGTMVIRGTGNIDAPGQLYPGQLERASKTDVKKIVVEWGITSIGARTFYKCNASEVILPNSLTYIGDEAFYFSNITELSMPDSVVSVGEKAFDSCDDLKKVRLSQNLRILSAGMLKDTDIQELIIPDSVEEIHRDALSGTSLKKLVIGKWVRYIEKNTIHSMTLREIQNQSTLDFRLNKFEIETDLIKWSVDGVRTNIVKAGKTAFGKGKEYKLVYKYMDGVTCQGKRPKTYEYGIPAKMPVAKKKGCVFFGWSWTEKQFAKSKSWIPAFNYVPNEYYDTGAIVVMPRFLKVSIKKKSKNRFMITADADGVRSILSGIGVCYSTDPTMKNCKMMERDFPENPKTFKKQFTIKAKKGKKYYIQFVLYNDGYYEDDEDNEDRHWSKAKVYKM